MILSTTSLNVCALNNRGHLIINVSSLNDMLIIASRFLFVNRFFEKIQKFIKISGKKESAALCGALGTNYVLHYIISLHNILGQDNPSVVCECCNNAVPVHARIYRHFGDNGKIPFYIRIYFSEVVCYYCNFRLKLF